MTILLGTTQISYAPLALAPAERNEIDIARRVTDFLFSKLEGSEDNPSSWIRLAHDLGCHVIEFQARGAHRGEYVPTRAGQNAVISYNTYGTRWMQSCALVHEIAHHVLVMWGIVPATRSGGCHYSLADSVSHRIARRVEKMAMV